MNAVDLTPTFALRKLAVLFDGGKVGECAALVRRLTAITLESVLGQLPVDILHDALPSSLPVLEAIYVKVSQRHPGHLPTDVLRTDQLVQRLVALFAKHPPSTSGTVPYQSEGNAVGEEKNCNLHVPCCRSILRVIMETDPNFRRNVAQRKRALDRCLRRMGQHGLVEGRDGKLLSLHEALKVEFDKQVVLLKAGLHKLEQLQLVSHGKHSNYQDKGQLTEASHQRLMQLSRGDVQERVIKNKTLLMCVEPTGRSPPLLRLLRILRARVEADKLLLFHDTELRKMAAHTSRAKLAAMEEPSQNDTSSIGSSSGAGSYGNADGKFPAATQTQQLAGTIQQFSQGYDAVLRLASEVVEAQGDDHTDDDEDSSGDEWEGDGVWSRDFEGEGDYLSVTSTLSIMKRMKVVSLNSLLSDSVLIHHHPNYQHLPPGINNAASTGRTKNGWLNANRLQPTSSRRPKGQLKKREASTQTTPTMENGEADEHTTNIGDPQTHRSKTQTAPNNRGKHNTDTAEGSVPPTLEPRTGTKNHASRADISDTSHASWVDTSAQTYAPGAETTAQNYAPGAGNITMLEQEVLYLRQELSAARKQIRKLQEQDRQLRERLHGQAYQQFQMGNDQFEDLSLGSLRPAELIRRYGELYTDARVEALDALDRLQPLKGLDILKLKILFSVVVLSFKSVQQNIGELRGRLRNLLGLSVPSSEHLNGYNSRRRSLQASEDHTQLQPSGPTQVTAAAQIEHHITTYLCKTAGTFELSETVFEVCQQIYATLYDYPCLKTCAGLLEYSSQCVRIAWGLGVQRCPYTISYDLQNFDDRFHSRFHTSDPDRTEVSSYLWPALVDAQGTCVSRAVVVT